MLLPTVSVSERLSSKNSHRNNLITIVITGGLILVLLFILLTIALPALEGPITEDNSSLELGSIAWYLNHVLASAVPIALELAVLFGFLRGDHLRAHIGEKRLPAGQMPALGKIPFHIGLFWTARFSSVVLFVRSARPSYRKKRSTRSSFEIAPPDLVLRKLVPILSMEVRNYAMDYPIEPI